MVEDISVSRDPSLPSSCHGPALNCLPLPTDTQMAEREWFPGFFLGTALHLHTRQKSFQALEEQTLVSCDLYIAPVSTTKLSSQDPMPDKLALVQDDREAKGELD